MCLDVKSPKTELIRALVISTVAVVTLFLFQGHIGFNLWDEGFLWYGVQRVLKGEVPVRDFMSYEPGRYYWTAALLTVVGDDGIMSVRAAVALFQGLGLFVALLLVARSSRRTGQDDVPFLLLSTGILVLWMFPRHKLFDISLSIFLVGVLTYLVTKPTSMRHVFVGLCVGAIAVFGRNHGLYGAIASVGVIAWINVRDSSVVSAIQGLSLWTVGALCGFLPIVLMAAFVPGFSEAFVEKVMFLFEHKATNLPLPVPWPWTVDFTTTTVGEAGRGLLLGLYFICTLMFAVFSVLWVTFKRIKRGPVPPVLVATAFASIPYAHYAFSRSDVGHLAQGIFPLLIGCLVILSNSSSIVKWGAGSSLLAASFWVMGVLHPAGYCYFMQQCVEAEVSGSRLLMDPSTAADITMIREIGNEYAPDDRAFIATPFWPGAYALLERRSPMWEIYALLPRSESFQRREIERIRAADPGFALVLDIPLDGREELRFRNTHPLVHQYIVETFEPDSRATPSTVKLYRQRSVKASSGSVLP